jgi:hypothetical protein
MTTEIQRVQQSRREREQEQDAKMERRIRLAMAAKVDANGNCFHCGRPLVKDGDDLLHPMPYLECKGPPVVNPVPIAYLRQVGGLPKLPEIKPVRRSFGERDDD